MQFNFYLKMFKFILMAINKNIRIGLLGLLAISCFAYKTAGQVHPVDGDTVNYRMVGFEVPEKKNATEYVLEVYETYIKDDNTVHTRFLFEQKSTNSKIVTTVPEFGKSYKWRVKYFIKNNLVDSTGYYLLSTGKGQYTDTAKYHMRVLKNELAGQDYYIFVDGTKTLYNMKGEAIWYLPDIPGVVNENSIIRDLEVTPFNTITFLTSKDACEIDYDGNILWKAPNDGKFSQDSIEYYHHEFARLSNGNYMVAGSKLVEREIPAGIKIPASESSYIVRQGKNYKKILAATLLEYDKAGMLVWSWLSDKYFSDADLFTPVMDGKGLRSNTHMNAFFFNETEGTIYTSHRNINRIVKIQYPSGNVLAQYGEAYNKQIKISGDGMFYGQHNCRVSKDGYMYLFNNNNIIGDSARNVSSVAFFKEPVKSIDTLKKIWEFQNDFDSVTDGITVGGGGVFELNTGNVLVCMAKCRNYIVSRSNKILWDSIIERCDENKNWKIVQSGYRSSLIQSQNKLHKIIYD